MARRTTTPVPADTRQPSFGQAMCDYCWHDRRRRALGVILFGDWYACRSCALHIIPQAVNRDEREGLALLQEMWRAQLLAEAKSAN